VANKNRSPSFARRSTAHGKRQVPSPSRDFNSGQAAGARPDDALPWWLGTPESRSWLAFWVVLALCVAWPLTHAFLVSSVTVRLCEDLDQGIPQDKRLPVFLHEIANDGYVWNRYAEELGQNGRYRLRFTTFDNAPDGRAVHWNSAFAWYLRALGELRKAQTGEPLRHAIFRMSIWANPILLAIALGAFAPLAARRFGPLCGAVIAIGMVSVPTFYEGFLPAYPDHHGVISFELLGMMFGIAYAGVGWIKSSASSDFAAATSFEQAKHGMTFSAICAGCGLWFSAISTAMVMVTLGISVLVTAWAFRRRGPDDPVFQASLWKWWAICGASASFALWLLEYFPNHMSMRLEVNHPLYALAFLGGGWLIAILGEWLTNLGTPSTQKPFPWRDCLWPAAAFALLPAFILVGGPTVYVPRDPFLGRVLTNIYELHSIFTLITHAGLTWQAAFGWYPLFLLMSFMLLAIKGPGRGTKIVLVFLTLPIILLIVLQCYQSRWGLLVGPIYIALAGVAVAQTWRLVPKTTMAQSVALVLFALEGERFISRPFDVAFGNSWRQFSSEKIAVLPGQALHLLHRQMARTILDDANGEPVVLLSSPNSSCILSSLGGFRTVGTLYWENVEGLEAAAAALNAQSNDDAMERVRKLGVTHVSLMTWENFIEPYFNILHPKPEKGLTVKRSFAHQALFEKKIPAWTRPLVFPPSGLSKGLNQNVLLLRVAPSQSENESRFHLARFVRHVEGKPQAAREMLEAILESSPESSLIRVEYAEVLAALGKFDPAVDELLRGLKDADAPTREVYTGNFVKVLMGAKQYKTVAKLLREVASRKDSSPGLTVQAAWVLATLPDDEANDGAFALELLDRLDSSASSNADVLLARAAAHAANGSFTAAIAALDESPFERVASPDQKRLGAALRASFQQGKPFVNP
jgi:tetratricopeptide (TPR) repeat protein